MESCVFQRGRAGRLELTYQQINSRRAKRVPVSYGEEADEGVYGRKASSFLLQPWPLQSIPFLFPSSRSSKFHSTNNPPQMFSNLVTHCFDSCIDDFTTKSLIQRETGCVSRCVKKFMAGSERIGARFQEQQAQMMNQPPPGR